MRSGYDLSCITEKLTPEGRKDSKKVLEWQKRFNEWLVSHGAVWKSAKHFMTLIGEPVYETWPEYSDYSALDEDEKRVKIYANNPEWEEMVSRMNLYFQRIDSRVMKEI